MGDAGEGEGAPGRDIPLEGSGLDDVGGRGQGEILAGGGDVDAAAADEEAVVRKGDRAGGVGEGDAADRAVRLEVEGERAGRVGIEDQRFGGPGEGALEPVRDIRPASAGGTGPGLGGLDGGGGAEGGAGEEGRAGQRAGWGVFHGFGDSWVAPGKREFAGDPALQESLSEMPSRPSITPRGVSMETEDGKTQDRRPELAGGPC